MKKTLFVLAIVPVFSLFFTACSSDPLTNSLSIQYGKIEIKTEKVGERLRIDAAITVRLINRTERGMNIAFLEGVILDQNTEVAIARFRPIIPDSYGSISTAQLLPKQVKEFQVVTPRDLEPFNFTPNAPAVVKLSFQTTDGYRTEVVSAAVIIQSK